MYSSQGSVYWQHFFSRDRAKKLKAIESARAAVVTQWTKKVIVEKPNLAISESTQEPLVSMKNLGLAVGLLICGVVDTQPAWQMCFTRCLSADTYDFALSPLERLFNVYEVKITDWQTPDEVSH